jgi:hypothetical protein
VNIIVAILQKILELANSTGSDIKNSLICEIYFLHHLFSVMQALYFFDLQDYFLVTKLPFAATYWKID